jgi:hypothetical protein
MVAHEFEGLCDPQAAPGKEKDGHIESQIPQKVLFASTLPLANRLKQLFDLDRGKHKRDDPVFPERWDVLKGVFYYLFPAQKEVEEDSH